jgi:3-hydroxy-9,10-secoandrosta-1,3,5(10)-triene-9,17-dione monooxygenase reductase component
MALTAASVIDQRHFRTVLGTYPTGVCIVTSAQEQVRFGMAVGSFTSISLDPALVGFFPDRSSTSWPRIEQTGRFCVNVLGADQVALCQRFASRVEDKFAGLEHGLSPGGLPVFAQALAWIECRIVDVRPIGDHLLVVGAVDALDVAGAGAPMVFYRGSYHTLADPTVT